MPWYRQPGALQRCADAIDARFDQNRSLDPLPQIVKYAPEEHLVIEIVNKTAATRNRSIHIGE